MAKSTEVVEVDPRARREQLAAQYAEVNAEAALVAFERGHPMLALSVAPPWMATPGEILEGTVFGIISRTHPEWGSYPIVGVRTPDGGFRAVHGLPQTLHDGLKAVRPQVGDPIVIAFMGERESAVRESDYHLYAVSIPGAAIPEYDWS